MKSKVYVLRDNEQNKTLVVIRAKNYSDVLKKAANYTGMGPDLKPSIEEDYYSLEKVDMI